MFNAGDKVVMTSREIRKRGHQANLNIGVVTSISPNGNVWVQWPNTRRENLFSPRDIKLAFPPPKWWHKILGALPKPRSILSNLKLKKVMKSTTMKGYLDLVADANASGHSGNAALRKLLSAVSIEGNKVSISDADYTAIKRSICGDWATKLEATFGGGVVNLSASGIPTRPDYSNIPFIVTTGWADKAGVRSGEALTVAPGVTPVIKTATVKGKTRHFIVFNK